MKGGFVLRIGADPTGIDFRLGQGFFHVGVDSAHELPVLFAVHERQRPGADEGLIQEVLLVCTGDRFASHENFLVLIQPLPGADCPVPF